MSIHIVRLSVALLSFGTSEVYECTVKGNNSTNFIFVSSLDGGQFFKERLLSSESRFFPLRVYYHMKSCTTFGRKQETAKVVSHPKNIEKKPHGVYRISSLIRRCFFPSKTIPKILIRLRRRI